MDLSGSWAYIESIAQSRLATNQTSRHVSRFGDTLEIMGVAGEIAVRRYLGLSEVVHKGFDHGVDLTFGGKKIDVKATILTPKLQYRFMQWPVWKKVRSDIVVLTAIHSEMKIAVIVGYATKAEVETAPVNNKRADPCHEISVRSLHPIWELVVSNLPIYRQ